MYKEVFAERLTNARKTAGYTQEQIAEITGIPRSNIAKYEKELSEPSLETLGILAQFYNVSIDWLLGVTIDKTQYPH